MQGRLASRLNSRGREPPDYFILSCKDPKIAKLLKFPRMGRMVPEIDNPAVRKIIWLKYRIIYRIQFDQIEIITIFHGSRDFSLQ